MARSETARFVRNATSSYAVRIPLVVSVLVLTPYLYRQLGEDGFGTWSVMLALFGVFGLLQAGATTAITKHVAELSAPELNSQRQAMVNAAILLMSLLGLVAALVAVLLSITAGGLAGARDRDGFEFGLLVIGATLLVQMPLMACSAVLNGYQRYDASNAAWLMSIVSFSIGAVIAVESGGRIAGLAIAYSTSLLIGGATAALLLRRIDPTLSLRPRRADRAAMRRVASFGGYSLLSESMVLVSQRLDTVLIAGLASTAAAAPYAAAVKLQSGLQMLTLPFVEVLLPMFSDLSARGGTAQLRRRFVAASRVVVQLTLPAAFALALFSQDLVGAWLGADASSDTAGIIVALMAVQMLSLTVSPAGQVLRAVGRVRVVALLGVGEAMTNITFSILLVRAHGAIGAALGTLIATALFAPLRIPVTARALACPAWELVRESYGRAVLSAVPPALAMTVVWTALEPGTVRLIAGLLIGAIAWAAIVLAQIGPGRLASLYRGASPSMPNPTADPT